MDLKRHETVKISQSGVVHKAWLRIFRVKIFAYNRENFKEV